MALSTRVLGAARLAPAGPPSPSLRRSNRPDGRFVELARADRPREFSSRRVNQSIGPARHRPYALIGAPYEIRTRVLALRGQCPRPLDEGSLFADLGAKNPRGLVVYGPIFLTQAEPSFLNASSTPFPPLVIPRSEHSISRGGISPNALKVLYRLKDAGYQGFLVGGAVRDLLLGITPKDFDVATNALPEEVRRLFRNCRLIGRRFRLAHVHFDSEIIEVATFRAASAPEREDAESDPDADGEEIRDPVEDSEHRAFDTRGRILRDNIYGTIEEDVWRRDFAANGLYYNIEDFSIWDFVDGVNDVKARRLTMIGDPETRYREDPVRMLRAVRFSAKLDFSIESNTEAPIRRLAYLLDGVPPARLFDEVLKLFLSGFGAKAFGLLEKYGLFEHMFPMSAAAFELPPYAYARQMLELGLA